MNTRSQTDRTREEQSARNGDNQGDPPPPNNGGPPPGGNNPDNAAKEPTGEVVKNKVDPPPPNLGGEDNPIDLGDSNGNGGNVNSNNSGPGASGNSGGNTGGNNGAASLQNGASNGQGGTGGVLHQNQGNPEEFSLLGRHHNVGLGNGTFTETDFSWMDSGDNSYFRDHYGIEFDRQVNRAAYLAFLKYQKTPPYRLLDNGRGLTSFGFDDRSWYYHCSVLAQLASIKDISLPAAKDRAEHFCSLLPKFGNFDILDDFLSMATPEGIKKIPRMDITSKIHLILTWGSYGSHIESRSANEPERPLFDSMRHF